METAVEVPAAAAAPETEVLAKARKRRFTAEYKRRILKEADRCTQPGQIGVLLRREGLYSSALTTWRAARERGELAGLAPKKRGRRPKGVDPRDRKIAIQAREIAQWKARAQRSEALVEIQKKSCGDPGLGAGQAGREALMQAVVGNRKEAGVAGGACSSSSTATSTIPRPTAATRSSATRATRRATAVPVAGGTPRSGSCRRTGTLLRLF